MMRNKRLRKHVQYFLRDYLWVIVLFLFAMVLLPVFCLVVVEKATTAWPYYCFLSLFLLLCFLGVRFYSTWQLYELFCEDKKEMEDFFLSEPKGREERRYQQLILELYGRYDAKLHAAKDARKQNKLMVYRWVHQLKTPLSVIQLIAQKNGLQEDYKKVSQAASQIQYDLDQILNMYKLDAIQNDFHVERIALRQLAKDSIHALKASFIERGIFPKLKIDDKIVVYSDSKWLRFVFYQLLTNALKYSDQGDLIMIQAYGTKEGIVLCIEDEGCGMEPEDIPRIFDLFFTGQNGRLRGESTGLGLYMVKQILDYLGHPIQVDSEAGVGSRFKILFERQKIEKE